MAKRQILQKRVTALIREAILSGKLRNNQRLIEADLAERFGVSRTPIRAAIRKLEEDGWLKSEPSRGAVVIAVSPKEVAELFSVRAVLEAFAAGEVCLTITDEKLKTLEALNREMENCDPEDNDTLRELNLRFHRELCSLSENTFLINLIENLWQRSQFFRQSVWYPPRRWKQSIQDHKDILNGLRRRDNTTVTKKIQQHITYSGGLLQELEKIYGNYK